MSHPAFEDWFSASIRRNRKSFMLSTATLFAMAFIIVLVVLFFRPNSGALALIFLLFGVPFVLCQYMLTAQRLRDMNATGWLALLWIPIGMADNYLNGAASAAFGIVLISVPGTPGPNRYGDDPLLEGAER